jgi:general secretion pathway protein G
MRSCRTQTRRDRGFTLIELVVVMMIISILAGAVALKIVNNTRIARRTRAIQDISTLETAIDLYEAHNGYPPTTQQGLQALMVKPSTPPIPRNWNGPYIKRTPIDPWAKPYIYRYPGQLNPDGCDIISYGQDEQPGGTGDADADITNGESE